MEEQLLSKCHSDLRQTLLGLESMHTRRPDRLTLLTNFNQDLQRFLVQLERLLQKQRADLHSRMSLQNAIREVPMDENALEMFWIDQLRFYQIWLELFGQHLQIQPERCLINLTAKEILMLLRLLKDLQLIANDQLKQLFHFISLNIRTEKQDLLSYESLRKKYSQIDVETLRQIKKVLEALMKRTNHYFALLSNK